MPDSNDVYLTKKEAQDGIIWLANEWRDQIAMARQDGEGLYPRISGNARDGFYEVEQSEHTSYLLHIEKCHEPDCLEVEA